MRELDETDVEILSLLAEDARRPFSAIGEQVGLSGPAVSDRVKRLQEAGIIERFTVDLDRSHLRSGVGVFVRVEAPRDGVEDLRERIGEGEGVEHVFVTADGEVWFLGHAEGTNVRRWLEDVIDEPAASFTVKLVDEAEWTPSFHGTEFAIRCAECSNTVDAQGESSRIDGRVYHFCCASCRDNFEETYRRLAEDA